MWGVFEFVLAVTKRCKVKASSRDRHSLALIWLVNLTAIALGVVAAYRLRCPLPWPGLFFGLGLSLYVLGLALRWSAIIYLGRFFTVNVSVVPGQCVVDSGPYRFIRHPSYAGGLLTVMGFALLLENWASFLAVVVPVFAVHLWRIYVEEAALLAVLGEPYQNYMRRTKRLMPLIY